jgi:prepilin-type N-terminal cleavage/methylation domain-containing protein
MRAPIVSAATPTRPARRRERGFTLIELLVTTAIMAIVAGGIGGAFAIGSKVMSRGGVQDRLAGANDGMVFEQVLSRDVSRASCMQVAGSPATGSCSKGFASSAVSSACSAVAPAPAARFCAAWPVISDSSCHVAVYTQTTTAPTGLVSRTEYRIAFGDPSAAPPTTTIVTSLQATHMGTDPFLALSFLPAGGPWGSAISVTLTNAVVSPTKNPPTVTLVLRPLATDPSGPGTTAITRAAQC